MVSLRKFTKPQLGVKSNSRNRRGHQGDDKSIEQVTKWEVEVRGSPKENENENQKSKIRLDVCRDHVAITSNCG